MEAELSQQRSENDKSFGSFQSQFSSFQSQLESSVEYQQGMLYWYYLSLDHIS